MSEYKARVSGSGNRASLSGENTSEANENSGVYGLEDLRNMHASDQPGNKPLFDPHGVFWRVNREGFLLAGGGAALLLQVAHPLIAAGVADHSRFREQPIRRLYSTITTMQKITYGDRQTALAAAGVVNRIHAGVHGVLAEDTPAFAAGTPYRATDPDLLLWVHTTLVATALRTYETFMPPLSAVEREQYHQEAKTIGFLLGLTFEQLPKDAAAYDAYFQRMITGPELFVTSTVAELADQIIHPPIPWIPRAAGDVLSVATAALLPEPVRKLYGLKWSRRRQWAWRLARRSLAEALPFVPDRFRAGRTARRSERQLRNAIPGS